MSGQAATAPDPKAAAQASPEAAGKGATDVKPVDQKTVTPPAAPAAPAGAAATPPAPAAVKPGEAPPKVDEKKPDAPAEVVYDLKLADGSPLKPEDVDAVKAFAKEHGLTAKQAQAQLDRESKATLTRVEAEKADLAAKAKVWKATTLADPELGGVNGSNLVRTTGRCEAALKRFDTDGTLTKILEVSGIGDLPDVVRFLEKIGAATEGDRFVVPPVVPAPTGQKKNEEVFYPKA